MIASISSNCLEIILSMKTFLAINPITNALTPQPALEVIYAETSRIVTFPPLIRSSIFVPLSENNPHFFATLNLLIASFIVSFSKVLSCSIALIMSSML